jgi:ubiquinone/menaquinone biosynthesis C-methylase UbiE
MTKTHFDKAAAEWDQKQRRVELAKAITENIALLPLNQEMRALEYGCGTGLVGLALAPRLGSLTAMDTSTGMLDILAGKIQESGVTNVTPLYLDLTVDTCIQRFDLIFSAMTLHHIENTELILQKFYQLLEDGGYLAIADLDSEDGSFHAPGAGEKHHGFSRETLSEKLLKLGFSSLNFKTVHTVTKMDEGGDNRVYPVFLLTAQKEHVF